MNKIASVLLSVIFVAFPFLIYFGLNYFSPIFFAILLFVLLIVRMVLMPAKKWLKIIMVSLIAIYCLSIGLSDGEQVLRYYPVLMTLYIAILFALSLLDDVPIIEKFAQLSGKPYPEGARVYMKKLTKIWVILLLTNACVAIYSACCQSIDFWLFYNGFLSYIIIFGFMACEWVFRQWYRRKNFPDFN
jgi:uncharacterized membrane protein